MSDHRNRFLRNEFLTLSLFGALQRSNTYQKNTPDKTRNDLRKALRKKLNELATRYEVLVTEEEHISNIDELARELSSGFSHCLKGGRFRIGIAQKALNLYLKYLWCIDVIPVPPHCPFDSIVIQHLPGCDDISWTNLDEVEAYKRLVAVAKQQAGGKSLSEWELEMWNEA